MVTGGRNMRLKEFADAEEQLALWRLVNQSVWAAIESQAKQQQAEKAAKAQAAKPKRAKRGAVAKPAKPRVPVSPPKPSPAKPAIQTQPLAVKAPTQQQQLVQPTKPTTALPSTTRPIQRTNTPQTLSPVPKQTAIVSPQAALQARLVQQRRAAKPSL